MVYGIIASLSSTLIVGFILGILVERRNSKKIEKALDVAKKTIADAQEKMKEKKT